MSFVGVSPASPLRRYRQVHHPPERVASTDIWLEATAGTLGRVGGLAWGALSDNLPDYTPIGVAGMPSLDFVAANLDHLRADMTSLGSGTTHHLFWVVDVNVVSANTQLLRANGLDLIVYLSNPSSQLGVYDGAHKNSGQVASTGEQLIELQLTPGAGGGRFYIDGVAVGSAFDYTASAINNGITSIFSSSDGLSGFVDCQFRHFVHCTSILVGAELDDMRSFLQKGLS